MDARRAERLYRKSDAGRWKVPAEVLSNALERGAEKAFAGRSPSEAELDRYFDSLHLSDLALACACAIGRNEAWDHFVRAFRPGMYRAADAIDPSGGAREIAEALYAELFGLRELDGKRQSVFRYFHGRSSLATWLRSLIAQRFVDRHREKRRLRAIRMIHHPPPSRARRARTSRSRSFRRAMHAVLSAAIATLAPRDRLRLALLCAADDPGADRASSPASMKPRARDNSAHQKIDSRRRRKPPGKRAGLLHPPRSRNASKRG